MVVLRNSIIQLFVLLAICLGISCGEKKVVAKSNIEKNKIDTVLDYTLGKVVGELSNKLKENSGLIYYRDLIWTIEDAGGKPKLYSVRLGSGKIKQKIEIIGSDNKDWEDITQDDKFIYIGDFGNNDGRKSVLRIYKISKNGIPWKGNFEVNPKLIEFSYPDQMNYSKAFHNTNFDCEAFICKGDSLYIFTKNWIDNKTKLYRIPKEEGSYIAKLTGTFDVKGLVTGAGISQDGRKIVLCGYKNQLPFIWYFSQFSEESFFSGNRIRLDITSLFGAQTEGICFMNNDTVFISNEKSNFLPSIYFFSSKKLDLSLGIN